MAVDSPLPRSLRLNARWVRLAGVPVMLVRPDAETPPPVVVWMHGRTVDKELDPGRYLRWMRAGIGACAVDLPGHGERYDAALQEPERTLDVVRRMLDELDPLIERLETDGEFDRDRMAIGGLSAGGMVTLARLCRPHRFCCASVEATSGAWSHQRHRAMFRGRDWAEAADLDPLSNLDGWREIPLQAIHARHDQWMAIEGQLAFLDALAARYTRPELIERVIYERTGAPYEHAGFGRMSADAKGRQTDFLSRSLRKAF